MDKIMLGKIGLVIFGTLIGLVSKVLYDILLDRKKVKKIKLLLKKEIERHIINLDDELKTLRSFNTYMMSSSRTSHEIVEKIKDACSREMYEKFREDIPLMGKENMEAVEEYYESTKRIPGVIKDLERLSCGFGDGFIEDVIKNIKSKASAALEKL